VACHKTISARSCSPTTASLAANAEKVAAEGVAIARSAGFAATPLSTVGSPVWRTIVDSAEELDAGIVVMGSHGRTGIGLVLMGSIASTVVRHAERPVLVVRAHGSHATTDPSNA
jgi:nucleotide-binding universal stress UspA family protein